jgi:hypothetical protein
VRYGEFRTVINRYPGSYALESDGDDLRLVGDAVIGAKGPGAQLRVPQDALLAELHATGRRALAFLHGLLEGDPAHSDALSALDALEAETAEALSSWT